MVAVFIDLIIDYLTVTTISLAMASSMMMLFDILFYLINFISQLYIYLLSLTTRLSSDGVTASGMVILYHFVILFCFAFFYFQFIIDLFPHRNDHLYDDGVQQHGLISDMYLFYFSFLISYYVFSYYVVCI